MTFVEGLNASLTGEFPMVKYENIRRATIVYGRIVAFRSDSNFKGCAVRFNDQKYDEWFYDEDGADGRKKHIKDLTLIKE
jgi:hypothetical protein